MHFTKMHGIGNDYVYVDCTKETVEDPAKVAVAVSDRPATMQNKNNFFIRNQSIMV